MVHQVTVAQLWLVGFSTLSLPLSPSFLLLKTAGALGHQELTTEKFPHIVEAFKNKTVKSVICGAQHTACIVIAGINQNQSLLTKELSRICEAERLSGGPMLGSHDEIFNR